MPPLNDLESWSKISEIVRNWTTALGILAAGIWSFYTFILGRTFSPNVQIQIYLKHVIELPDGNAAVVTIKVRNIGQMRTKKQDCTIFAMPIKDDKPGPKFSMLGAEESKMRHPILKDHTWLEPAEEITEDVIFKLGTLPFFKVGVMFTGHGDKKWASYAVLDLRPAKDHNNSNIT